MRVVGKSKLIEQGVIRLSSIYKHGFIIISRKKTKKPTKKEEKNCLYFIVNVNIEKATGVLLSIGTEPLPCKQIENHAALPHSQHG